MRSFSSGRLGNAKKKKFARNKVIVLWQIPRIRFSILNVRDLSPISLGVFSGLAKPIGCHSFPFLRAVRKTTERVADCDWTWRYFKCAFLENAVARGATTKCNVDDKRRPETRCQNDGTAKGNDMIGLLYAVRGMFVVLRFPPLKSTPLPSFSPPLLCLSLPLSQSLSLCLPRALFLLTLIVAHEHRRISCCAVVYDLLNDSDTFSRLNFVRGIVILRMSFNFVANARRPWSRHRRAW